MPHKLSLLKEQTISENGWGEFANNPYDEGKIADITDNMGKQEVPVTSIPSPFAQMHLFETSFSFINKAYTSDNNDVTALSGNTTYHNYISNCLDVFELLFSYETLKLRGRIAVEIWKKEELDELLKSHNQGIKTFAETLKIFINNYNNANRFKSNGITDAFNEFILIYIDNTIVAGTSPYTGFFTIGDELPKKIKSNYNNRYFFTTNEPLYKRGKEFQEFINAFFEGNSQISGSFKEVYNYIKINRNHIEDHELKDAIKTIERNRGEEFLKGYTNLEINRDEVCFLGGSIPFMCDRFDAAEEENAVQESDYVIQTSKTLARFPLALVQGLNKKRWTYYGSNKFTPDLELVTYSSVEERKLPGSVISYPWITRNDMLSKHLIQLDYKVNTSKFWLPNGDVQDILIPVTPEYFNYFTIADLKEQISITKLKLGAIVVRLDIPVAADNGKGVVTFERTYDLVSPDAIDNDDYGAILKSSMAFGVYPFFKVADSRFNDRYKVLSYHMVGEEIAYQFFREHTSAPQYTTINSSLISRTRKEESYPCVSNYIDLTNIKTNNQGETIADTEIDITFDAVQVAVRFLDENEFSQGVLLPLMGEPIQLKEGKTVIAFDIGTSNSFVAFKTGNTPEHLSTYKGKKSAAQPDLVMLNEPKVNSEGIKTFDLDIINPIYGRTQVAEFLPTLLGKDSFFKFPIRSIINIDNDTNPENTNSVSLLSNVNIPFGFGQNLLRRDFDFTHSNIKWGVTDGTNVAAQNKLTAFIEQLIWLGRNKLLSEGYNPAATDVLWFKPLSMGSNQTSVFNGIWEKLYDNYYGKYSGTKKLMSITESWAPFYSYDRTFGTGEVYMNLDIGGGTSDLILFRNNQPALTTSFRFAGNSLFESRSGNNPFDNGFVSKYEAIMRSEFGEEFTKTDIIDYIKNSKGLLSTDLISYFFSYNSFSKKLMLDSEFKLLFLLHNSSIFYHSFQVLKMSDIDKLPSYIGISGNGAKLLEITNGLTDLNKPKGVASLVSLIIKKVFEKENTPKIELQILSNPKESTAIGGIKGLEYIRKNATADIDNYFLCVGNDKDLFRESDIQARKEFRYGKFIEPSDTTINEITENVIGFFNFFFDELWHEAGFIKNFGLEKSYNPEKLRDFFADASKISDTIREVINHKIEVEQEPELNDSLFFDAIKSYLYAFSRIIVSEKINEFKGV